MTNDTDRDFVINLSAPSPPVNGPQVQHPNDVTVKRTVKRSLIASHLVMPTPVANAYDVSISVGTLGAPSEIDDTTTHVPIEKSPTCAAGTNVVLTAKLKPGASWLEFSCGLVGDAG